jgi:hypothetical protein
VGLYGLFLWNFTAKLNPEKKEENEMSKASRELLESYVEAAKKRKHIQAIKAQTLQAEIDRIKFDLQRAEFALDNDRASVLRTELSGKTTELDEMQKKET